MGRRSVRGGVAVLAGALLAGAVAVPAHAVTACTTAALLTDVAAGGTVDLTPYCVYTLGDGDGEILVSANVTIHGHNATIRRDPNATTDFRVFEVGNVSLTMDALTVMNGDAPSGQDGGGVLLSGTGAVLTTTDVNFQGNRAQNGGGLAVEGSANTVSLTGGVINDNSASQTVSLGGGGGIHAEGDSPIALNSVTLSGNRAGFGGAIGLSGFIQTLSIDNCALKNNTGATYGGAISNAGDGPTTITITDSSLTDNQVPRSEHGGGAFAGQNLTLDITGSTISGNVLRGFATNDMGEAVGGGILVENGTATLDSTTVTGNRVIGPGGQGAGIAASGGPLTLQNGTSVSENLAAGRYSQGGGLYIIDILGPTIVTVTDSRIDSNKVTGTGSVAGGIYNSGGSISLSDSTVDDNTAPTAPAPGGVWTDTQFTSTTGSAITGNVPTNCLLSPVIVTGCVN